MDKKKLFVGSLPWSLSSQYLKDLFSPFGEIVDVVVISDSATGRSKGFGFVTFSTEESADKAQKEMNEKEVEGRNIIVNFAKPREERPGGGGGGFRRDNFGGGRNNNFRKNRR